MLQKESNHPGYYFSIYLLLWPSVSVGVAPGLLVVTETAIISRTF